MFNQQKAIEKWKRELAERGLDRDSIEELESHLHDAIDDHRRDGKSENDSFTAACSQIGSSKDIGAEFRKVEQLLLVDKLALTFGCIVVIALIVGLVLPIIYAPPADSGHLPRGRLLYVHVFTLILAYMSLLSFAGFGIYSVLRRLVTTRSESAWLETFDYVFRWDGLTGLGLVITGLVTGAIWAHGNMGAYWSWDPKEIGCLGVLFWFVVSNTCVWLKITRPSLLPAMSIFGGMVCLVAWFGTLGLPVTFVFVICFTILLAFLVSALRIYRKPASVVSVE